MARLEIRGVSKRFGGHLALDAVSFAAEDGEFCILLGPSGCGKTTALRIVAGLERQDAGAVLMDGVDVTDSGPRDRDVAMVFQSYALYPHMNVFENMAFALRMGRVPRGEIRARVEEAARLLGIEDLLGRRARELSGGQRQRVAIGRAIVRKPRLFLFDEPLSNLDAQLRAAMRIELARLHRRLGTTMLYVTHDQVEAMTLGSKVVLFERGSVRQVGTPKQIYERPANVFAASFVGSPRINLVEGALALREGRAFFAAPGIELPLPPGEAWAGCAGRAVTLGVRPEALLPGEGPLRGTVEFVEDLGAEVILHAGLGDRRWSARLAPGFRAAPGEAVRFDVAPTGVHLFVDGERFDPSPQGSALEK